MLLAVARLRGLGVLVYAKIGRLLDVGTNFVDVFKAQKVLGGDCQVLLENSIICMIETDYRWNMFQKRTGRA